MGKNGRIMIELTGNSLAASEARRIAFGNERLNANEDTCERLIDFQLPVRWASETAKMYQRVRGIVLHLDHDRYTAPEIGQLVTAVSSGGLVDGIL